MKKINIKKRELLFFIFVFLIVLVISFCVPINGDDWQNYGNGKFGIIQLLRNAKKYFFLQEGRISSRILIFFLTYYKNIWNIVNAIAYTACIYSINRITNKRLNIGQLLITTFLMLFLNYNIILQCSMWIAGNVTYFIPMVLFLLYIYYCLRLKKDHSSSLTIAIGCVYNIFMCTFVENLTTTVIIFNLFMIISFYIKNKKIDRFYLLSFLFSIMGLCVLLFSPGTMKRISDYPIFSSLSLFGKIVFNYSNLVNYTYVYNPIIILIISTFSIKEIKTINNNLIRALLLAYFIIIPVFTILYGLNQLSFFEFNILNQLSESLSFLNGNSILIQIYWTIYTIIFMLLILSHKNKDKEHLLLLALLSYASNMAMMLSPLWSARVTLLSNILFILFFLYYNKSYEMKKRTRVVVITFLGLYVSLMIFAYINVKMNLTFQNEQVLQQLNTKSEKIIYYTVPGRKVYTSYPDSIIYKYSYLDTLGVRGTEEQINSFIFVDSKWKYQLLFNKKATLQYGIIEK